MAGPTIAGYDLQKLVDSFNQQPVKNAQKALNYLDGHQVDELKPVLAKAHKKWEQRGYFPRTRNITEAVISKSAQLFKDAPPKMSVYVGDDATKPDEAQTANLNDLLSTIEFTELLVNLDQVVRLCKTGILLVAYDPTRDELLLDILHRANACVKLDPIYRTVTLLLYKVSDDGEGNNLFRIYTVDTIYDISADNIGIPSIIGQQPNPYGIIPITPFYDSKTPLNNKFWVETRMDLVDMNEVYNLGLTESEFTMRRVKSPSIFINFDIDADSLGTTEVMEVYGEPLPRLVGSSFNGILGGPDQMVHMTSPNDQEPKVIQIAPEADLQKLDTMITSWVNAFAHDWSVKIDDLLEGASARAASSGYALQVMEIPNMELRQTRQRMFESGFKRFFKILKQIYNLHHPFTFADDANLFVDFAEPDLPTDPLEEQNVWNSKFHNGTGSRISFFMETEGLTREQAEETVKQIDADNIAYPVPTVPTNMANDAIAGPGAAPVPADSSNNSGTVNK